LISRSSNSVIDDHHHHHHPGKHHLRNPTRPLPTMPIVAPCFTKFVLERPWLTKLVRPVANWYANAAGYRQMGLK
jgi:hypothetical protein